MISHDRGLWWLSVLVTLAFVFSSCALPRRCHIPRKLFAEIQCPAGWVGEENRQRRGDIECRIETRRGLERRLERQGELKALPHQYVYEAEMFRALGMIPEDFSYPKGLIRQIVRDLKAFYDHTDRMIIVTSGSVGDERVLRHELVHFFQDERFSLSEILHPRFTHDTLFARLTALEGEAIVRSASESEICAVDHRARLHRMLELRLGGVDGLPPSLRLFLEFPYIVGPLIICQRIEARKDRASLLEDLPVATGHLLGADEGRELLLSRTIMNPRLEPVPAPDRVVYRDRLGALGLLAFLGPFAPAETQLRLVQGVAADEFTLSPLPAACRPGKYHGMWRLRVPGASTRSELFREVDARVSSGVSTERVYEVSLHGEEIVISILSRDCAVLLERECCGGLG